VDEPGAARARTTSAALITPQAFDFADKLAAAMRLDRDDPRCVGMPYEAQRWLFAGWSPDLCVATVTRLAAGRDIGTLKYFEKAIARAHAELAAPVPVVAAPKEEVIHAEYRQSSGGAYGATKDRGRAAHAKLKAYLDATKEDGGGGGRQVVELVPAARRHGS
jgi:hypothetical protein